MDAIALVKEWIRGDLEQDKAAKEAVIADDVILEIPFSESGRTDEGYFRRYTGRAEVLGFVDTAFAAEKNVEIVDPSYSLSADGSDVFVECYGNVEMTSGQMYRNRYVMRFKVSDNKIVLIREYYNPIVSAIAFQREIAGQVTLDHA
tara:strand:- start:11038 stop:11478 length:441 start_codon:yes stop_codon:yes gene_type:complete